jgi:hypothetical protein
MWRMPAGLLNEGIGHFLPCFAEDAASSLRSKAELTIYAPEGRK